MYCIVLDRIHFFLDSSADEFLLQSSDAATFPYQIVCIVSASLSLEVYEVL